ncbi:hypothetical protein D3C71_2135460 [compost metagenome]
MTLASRTAGLAAGCAGVFAFGVVVVVVVVAGVLVTGEVVDSLVGAGTVVASAGAELPTGT